MKLLDLGSVRPKTHRALHHCFSFVHFLSLDHFLPQDFSQPITEYQATSQVITPQQAAAALSPLNIWKLFKKRIKGIKILDILLWWSREGEVFQPVPCGILKQFISKSNVAQHKEKMRIQDNPRPESAPEFTRFQCNKREQSFLLVCK